jgi:hypothetical protein
MEMEDGIVFFFESLPEVEGVIRELAQIRRGRELMFLDFETWYDFKESSVKAYIKKLECVAREVIERNYMFFNEWLSEKATVWMEERNNTSRGTQKVRYDSCKKQFKFASEVDGTYFGSKCKNRKEY